MYQQADHAALFHHTICTHLIYMHVFKYSELEPFHQILFLSYTKLSNTLFQSRHSTTMSCFGLNTPEYGGKFTLSGQSYTILKKNTTMETNF
jgi:hypothetical protein